MISIIIPITFDVSMMNVEATIKSILNQTYKNIRIVIGLKSDINVKVSHIENIYIEGDVYLFDNVTTKYDMLNKLIPYVKTDWVGFAEPGDEWYNNKIESQIQYINKYDIIGCSCRFTGSKNGMPSVVYGKIKDYGFINGRPFVDNTVIMKTNLCKWQTKYGIHADYKMFYKLYSNNHACFNIPEVLLSCKVFIKNNNDVLDKDILQKLSKKIRKSLGHVNKFNYLII